MLNLDQLEKLEVRNQLFIKSWQHGMISKWLYIVIHFQRELKDVKAVKYLIHSKELKYDYSNVSISLNTFIEHIL